MRKTLNEAIDFGKVAEKAVAIMKGKGHSVVMFTLDGMETADPEEARRFYVKEPNYMVTIDEDNAQLRINKNSKVKLEDIEAVMKQLRNLARQYMLKSELKVFGKEIAPKDFAYQAKKYRDKKMNPVSEAALSRMSGSKKTSYQTLESTKIIVRHRKSVDEDVRGARSRQIKAIFIERAGERFRFPHNNLAGARAMARHIDEGGEIHDSVGTYIIESVANLIKLSEFVRYTRTNKLINETSEDIIKIVRENMAAYRREISKFQGATTYAKMCEQIASREGSELEEDTDELKDMFTVRKFDEKIGDTLPLIKRLVTEKNAWRSMIEEASTEAFAVTSTEDLIETDAIEFSSPIQQLGYKIRALSERVIDESELSKFVHKIGNKLIEGNELSKFEKSVVGNVLENIEVAEQAETEFVDKLEEAFAGFERKMNKLAEARYDPVEEVDGPCRWWAMCDNDATTTEPHPILGDVPICDRCVSKLRKIEGLDEDDNDGCETCRGWDPDDQSVCPDCFGQNAIDGSVTEDPGDFDHGYNYEGPQSDDLGYDPETQWMDPAGGIHDNDEEDPAAMYEDDIEEGMFDSIAKAAGRGLGKLAGKGIRKLVDKAVQKHIDIVKNHDVNPVHFAAKYSGDQGFLDLLENWMEFNKDHEDFELVKKIYQMAGGKLDSEKKEEPRKIRAYEDAETARMRKLAGLPAVTEGIVRDIQRALDAGKVVYSGIGGAVGNVIDLEGPHMTVQHRYRGKGVINVANVDGLRITKSEEPGIDLLLRNTLSDTLGESDAEKAGSGKADPEDFMDECPACEGTGNEFGEGGGGDCEKCDGNGYV